MLTDNMFEEGTVLTKKVKFWIKIGATILPAYLKSKKVALNEYKKYRVVPPTEEELQTWFPEEKRQNIAVMMGRLKNGRNLICFDLDDEKAVKEFLRITGYSSLEELAQHTRVEVHKDNPNSAHVFYITDIQFENRAPDTDENVPGIDIRATNKLTVIVADSIHVDGHPYEVLGTEEIAECGIEMLQNIKNLFKEYNADYMNNGVPKKRYDYILKDKTRAEFDPTKKIPKRARHTTLLREFGREVQRNYDKKTKGDFIKWGLEKNEEWCQVPLAEDEVIEMMSYCVDSRQEEKKEILSVSQALRRNSGEFEVKGTITSMTPLYKMISSYGTRCNECGDIAKTDLHEPFFIVKPSRCTLCGENALSILNKDYFSVVTVELQDLEAFNDMERLSVLLFNKDTESIRVGENVLIQGKMHINESKGKKLFPCFYAKSIQYEKNSRVVLKQQDIEAIKRFANFVKLDGSRVNIIDELVNMVDPSVIGCDNVKLGLLFSAVNSGSDIINYNFNYTRQRIHSLLIGEKGLAKSKLLRSAVRMVHNSRYETGQYSSGKSLTAIVAKEEENYILRLGPIPLARNAICGINEFGRRLEDQDHFLDVMEEGFFTFTKYGINATINSPTTIIASANPLGNSNWNSDEKIDIDEIPALKPVFDRFDLVFVFRSQKDEKEIRKYAYKKDELEAVKVPDYSYYLTRHLEYAKRFNPKIDSDARAMLTEFFIKIRARGFGSNRVLDTLYRLSKAVARLKLKEIVDVEDAEQVMKFYNEMLENFEMSIDVSANPKQLTYDKFVETLQNSKNMDTHVGTTVQELHRIACNEDDQIASYLGPNWSTDTNKKLRNIVTMLRNNRHVQQVGLKPLILKWLSDPSDPSDPQKSTEINKNSETSTKNEENKIIVKEKSGSYESYRSDMNTNIEYPPHCYYCNEYFNGKGKQAYEKHVLEKHKGKLCYPNVASLEKDEIEGQGMSWE